MQLIVQLTREDILELIPYMLIAEVSHSSVWNTMRRKNLFPDHFPGKEGRQALRICAQAYTWYTHGVPETGISITLPELGLWNRLYEFCALV